MLGLKPIKLLPARERVASALRKAIISKSIRTAIDVSSSQKISSTMV